MEKFITKKLEKFVSNVQNSIFASRFVRFRGKVSALNESTGEKMEFVIRRFALKCRKAYKYAYGKERTKRFLIQNINAFEHEHNQIVRWIENGGIKDNWTDYELSKARISAILKANRRLNRMNVTNNENVTSVLNEYINQRRFAKKYELST